MPPFTKVLVVERLSDEVRAILAARDPRVFRFKQFPLIALTEDHPSASSPLPDGVVDRLDAEPTQYSLAWAINRVLIEADHLARTWAPNGNRWVCGSTDPPQFPTPKWDDDGFRIEWVPLAAPTRIAHPTSLNLSRQLRPGPELPYNHLLSIATRMASRHMPVIVAAGNWFRRPDRDTLSPLAKLPWTISVGATADRDGRSLHPLSSAGRAPKQEQVGRPDVFGPTVVAYGENPFNPGTFGTSFAVPRVSFQIALLTAFVLEIQHTAATLDGVLRPPPPLLQCMIDSGFEGFDPKPENPLPALPIIGVDRDALAAAVRLIGPAVTHTRIVPTPARIRQMLIESATPVAGYGAHEVGAGFVSDLTTGDYITRFSGFDLARIFSDSDVETLEESVRRKLREIVLAVPREVEVLRILVSDSLLRYAIDSRSGRVMASMRDPGMDPAEKGYWKEEPARGPWPPPL